MQDNDKKPHQKTVSILTARRAPFLGAMAALIAFSFPVRAEDSLSTLLNSPNPHLAVAKWDADALHELATYLPRLDDASACRILWLVAGAPMRLDTTRFFRQALTSPSSVVKGQAADILLSQNSEDSLRILNNFVMTEDDEETVSYIISGMASVQGTKGVHLLMELILSPGLKETTIIEVSNHLRRLTRTTIPSNPSAWRDWWFDNADFYE